MYRSDVSKWTVERAVFLVAGIFVFVSVALGFFMSAHWFYFTGFVGCMLIFFALTGYCPMAGMLHKCGVGQTKTKE